MPSKVPKYRCRIIRSYPHDPTAFTQGLVLSGKVLYESTGLYGKSSLRKVLLQSGKIIAVQRLRSNYFGEGLTLWKNTLIQLTWRENIGRLYDVDTLKPKGQFAYSNEGWGITHDGENLIMSDGSARLRFLDPETFQPVRTIEVRAGKTPIRGLNELEFVKGEVFANVWPTSFIVRISLFKGSVTGWIDCSNLCQQIGGCREDTVLNGIAYDNAKNHLLLTGKLWPRIFEVKLVASID